MDAFRVDAEDTKGYAAFNTVSGTGMNMPLKNVPMTINIMTSEFLSDVLTASTFKEAFQYNSSMTQSGRYGANTKGSLFSIRGFSAQYNLLDGVEAGPFIDPMLIDRIEVVKGPNTIYGQSDPGGVINTISKRALDVNAVETSIRAGDMGRLEGTLDMSTRTADKRLGLRALVRVDKSDGFRTADGDATKFGGLIGDFKVDDTTALDFYLTRREFNGIPVERGVFSFQVRPTDLNGDGVIDSTRVNGVVETAARYNNNFLPRDWTSQTESSHNSGSDTFMSGRIVKNITKNSVFQYRFGRTESAQKVLSREYNTFTAAGIANLDIRASDYSAVDVAHTLNLSNQFELAGLKHSLLTGVRWSDSESVRYERRFFRNDSADAGETQTALQKITQVYQKRLGDPSFNFRPTLSMTEALGPIWKDIIPTYEETMAYGKNVINPGGPSATSVNTYYLTDSIALMNDRLHILAGVRQVKIKSVQYNTDGTEYELPNIQSNLSTQGGVNYALTDTMTLFGSYATAFIPNGRVGYNREFFPAGESEAGELGMKFTDLLGGKITGSASVFHILRTNVNSTDYEPISGQFRSEQADQRSQGVDLELFFNPTSRWSGMLNYSYLDAKVVKSATAALGLRLQDAPPHRFTAWTSYKFSDGDEGLRLGGGVVVMGGPNQQFNNTGSRQVFQGSYTTFDCFARYTARLGGQLVTVGLNVSNLTDQKFVSSRGAINTPRQILFSLNTTF